MRRLSSQPRPHRAHARAGNVRSSCASSPAICSRRWSASASNRVSHDIAENEMPDARARLDPRDQHDRRGRASHARSRRAVGPAGRAHRASGRHAHRHDRRVPRADCRRREFEASRARSTPITGGARGRSVPADGARPTRSRSARNLSEVLLAQGYQDLTGQIIRSVMKLVEELEIGAGRPGAALGRRRRARARCG